MYNLIFNQNNFTADRIIRGVIAPFLLFKFKKNTPYILVSISFTSNVCLYQRNWIKL